LKSFLKVLLFGAWSPFYFAFGAVPMNFDLSMIFKKLDPVLDPHKMEDLYSMMAILQIHRGLVRNDPSGSLKPDLAARWHVSEDGKKYLFNLKDSKFANGRKIEAHHVVNSLARMFFLESSMSADLSLIAGSSDLKEKKNLSTFGVRARSKQEVEIELKKPSRIFLRQLAAVDCAVLDISDPFAPLAESVFESGSGPYLVTSRAKGTISLKKWRTDELDSAKAPKTILMDFSGADPVEKALTGKNDTLDQIELSEKLSKKFKEKGWFASPTEQAIERFAILNPQRLSREMRERVLSVVDQSKLLPPEFHPRFQAAYGLVPPLFPDSLTRKDYLSATQDFNKTIVQEKNQAIEIAFAMNSKVSLALAEGLARQLKDGGLTVDLKPTQHQDLLKMMFAKEGQVIVGGKGLDYFESHSILAYFRSGISSNYFHVSEPSIDRLLTEHASEGSEEKARNTSREIQTRVLKNATVLPLGFGSDASGMWGPKLRHVPAHPGGIQTLPFETLELR
jgi:ABC-type oligopeptide transport system substrate-binding subunit